MKRLHTKGRCVARTVLMIRNEWYFDRDGNWIEEAIQWLGIGPHYYLL